MRPLTHLNKRSSPTIRHLVTIRDGQNEVLTLRPEDVVETETYTTSFIQLADLLDATGLPGRRRRRRPQGPGPIQRLLDPDREHPVLKNLIKTFAPLIQQFINDKLIPMFATLPDDEPEP